MALAVGRDVGAERRDYALRHLYGGAIHRTGPSLRAERELDGSALVFPLYSSARYERGSMRGRGKMNALSVRAPQTPAVRLKTPPVE